MSERCGVCGMQHPECRCFTNVVRVIEWLQNRWRR